MRRRGPAIAAIALLLWAHGARAAEATTADACPGEGDEAVTVAVVEPGLELRLGDGRLLRLVGVDPATATPGDAALADAARARLAGMIAGQPARVRLLGAKPDRWGRRPAYVFPAGTAVAGGLAATVIEAGLGRWRAEEDAHACRDVFRAAEAKARAGPLGLWRDPYYAVLAAEDGPAFAGRSATVVVAEGRVAGVERDPRRTRLRFAARDRRDALVATILPRAAKTFEASGVQLETLTGRTLRVRGLLDLRFGPHLDIASPDALEILAPAPPGAG